MRGKEAYRLTNELMLFPLVLLAMLFFYVVGNYLLGPDWPASGALLYMVMTITALSMAWFAVEGMTGKARQVRLQELLPRSPMLKGAFLWFTGFLVTWCAALLIFGQGMGTKFPTIPASQAQAMFYFTMLFVAPAEEILFRGVIPHLTEERYFLGKVPIILIASQAAFAVFHIAAYGGIGTAMLIVFILGVIWVYAARRFGLFVTMGSHTAYNLTVLGVISGGVI